MTAPDHADLRALAEKATPGPWGVASTDDMGFAVHRGEHETVALYCDRDNAAYIASTSPDRVTALLDELDRLRATVARVEALVILAERRAVVAGDRKPAYVPDFLLRAALTDPEET